MGLGAVAGVPLAQEAPRLLALPVVGQGVLGVLVQVLGHGQGLGEGTSLRQQVLAEAKAHRLDGLCNAYHLSDEQEYTQ